MQASIKWAIRTVDRQSGLSRQYLVRTVSDQAGQRLGILAEYQRLLIAGRLHADATQLAAVQALQLLQDSMVIRLNNQLTHTTKAAAAAESGSATVEGTVAAAQAAFFSSGDYAATSSRQWASDSEPGSSNASAETAAAGHSSSSSRPVVQGAYLWGPVGSGKTLLMDMFIRTLPTVIADGSNPPSQSTNSSNSGYSSDQQAQGYQVLQLRAHRVHYHEFMLAVHEQLHQLQQSLPKIVTMSRSGLPVYRYATPPDDPILAVARAAASGLHLLCLDELHVTDVADAMLLSRLFGEVMHCGCSVMFTSNRPARDLYKGGLSRKYFEPFIKLIDDRLLQLKVAGGRDYRMEQQQQQQQQGASGSGAVDIASSSTGLWFTGPGAQQQLQQHWNKFVQQLMQPHAAGSSQGWSGRAARIQLPFGRTLWLPQALVRESGTATATVNTCCSSGSSSSNPAHDQQEQQLAAALFTFDQLCSNQGSRQSLEHAGALSANDYLALVRSCPVIFVQGLPQLTPKLRDEARRLVTLIDLVYEAHTAKPGSVMLVVSGEVSPHELFLPLLGAAAAQGVNPNLGKSSSRLDVKQLVQEYGRRNDALPASGDTLGASAGEVGWPGQPHRDAQHSSSPATVPASSASSVGASGTVSALLPEEVLMYHRAASRLAELCSVVGIAVE